MSDYNIHDDWADANQYVDSEYEDEAPFESPKATLEFKPPLTKQERRAERERLAKL